MKQIFIDTETTGLDSKKDKIKQLALIYKKNGKIIKKLNLTKNICYEFNSFLESIIDPFDKKDKAYLLAWNAKFDSEFLHELLKTHKNRNYGNYFYHMPVDIQQYAAFKFMKKQIVPDNFKLETIAKYFKIPCKSENFHDAQYDIDITNKIYLKLQKI